MTERLVAIYALCDSRESDPVRRVRYVGQTIQPLRQRLGAHWRVARAGEDTHRARWMRCMESAGAAVIIEEILRVPGLFADVAEIDCIARFRNAGADLTNTSAGGGGLWNPSSETRQKMSEGARGHKRWVGRKHTLESRAKMRASHIGLAPSADHRHKLSVALRGTKSPLAKLTWQQVDEIRRRAGQGESISSLGRVFGVGRRTIGNAVHNRTWVAA